MSVLAALGSSYLYTGTKTCCVYLAQLRRIVPNHMAIHGHMHHGPALGSCHMAWPLCHWEDCAQDTEALQQKLHLMTLHKEPQRSRWTDGVRRAYATHQQSHTQNNWVAANLSTGNFQMGVYVLWMNVWISKFCPRTLFKNLSIKTFGDGVKKQIN